jgi:hypothetical protein
VDGACSTLCDAFVFVSPSDEKYDCSAASSCQCACLRFDDEAGLTGATEKIRSCTNSLNDTWRFGFATGFDALAEELGSCRVREGEARERGEMRLLRVPMSVTGSATTCMQLSYKSDEGFYVVEKKKVSRCAPRRILYLEQILNYITNFVSCLPTLSDTSTTCSSSQSRSYREIHSLSSSTRPVAACESIACSYVLPSHRGLLRPLQLPVQSMMHGVDT